MKLEMLKSKLHQACITQADVDYEGSLGIDVELMEAVGIQPYEKVLVANINNGSRLETYAIAEPFGSRRMVLNGAAARHGSVGDRIIVMSFCHVDSALVKDGRFRPRVLRLDERNEPVRPARPTPTSDEIVAML
jgi:aspartate 1-decarboxylase